MSDSESGGSHVSDSLEKIHHHVEKLYHLSKHIYTRALRVSQLIDNPDLDLWTESFALHERARPWAKKYMIASRSSLWQIHETLLTCAKKDGRIKKDNQVILNELEAEILDLPGGSPIAVWTVLGRLPRFFH
jgi:hypothetical protein